MKKQTRSISYNPFTLEGKNILVTGAAGGIGQVTAIECSKMGANVIVTDRNEECLKETLLQLEGDGHQMIVADLGVQEDIEALAEECPILNGIVHNAGTGIAKPVNFLKLEDFQYVYQTNVFGAALLTKGLLRGKKISKGSSIVFTSSISSYLTAAGLSVYASSKTAINAYMRTCAIELGTKGIRSNSVLPGMVETALINSGAFTDADKERDLKLYPLSRYGRSTDIAYGIIYLLSDASAWVSGTEFVIDGGRMLK